MTDTGDEDRPAFGRSLFTDREREILAGGADVKDNYEYKVKSVARERVGRIAEDVDVLRESHPELLEELQAVVCDES